MKTDNIKNALVIGATGGVGKDIVLKLIEAGFHVVLSARNKEKLTVFADSFSKDCVTIIAADLSESESIDNLFSEIESSFTNPINLVVVAAGGHVATSLDDSFEKFVEDTNSMVAQNLVVPAMAMFRATKYLKENRGGRIINISSHAAYKVLENNMAYAPAKSGISSFVEQLSAATGEIVHVTDIQPAVINTESMTANLGDQAEKAIQPATIGDMVAMVAELDKHTNIPLLRVDADVVF